MKRYFFLIVFFCVFIPLTAQIDTKIPDWVIPVEFKNITVNKNEVTGGYYYSLIDEQHNTISKQNLYHYARVALNEEAQGFNWLLLLTIVVGLIASGILIWYLNKLDVASPFEQKHSSIGGWLVLIAIGAVIAPLNYIGILLNHWEDQKDINYYFYFFNEHSVNFSPWEGIYKLFTAFSYVFMLVYSVFLVSIFFQMRAAFRIHFSIYKLLGLLFTILNVVVMYSSLSGQSTVEEKRAYSSLIGSFVGIIISSFIWVPYIWYSERSRHTFTNKTNEGRNTY